MATGNTMETSQIGPLSVAIYSATDLSPSRRDSVDPIDWHSAAPLRYCAGRLMQIKCKRFGCDLQWLAGVSKLANDARGAYKNIF